MSTTTSGKANSHLALRIAAVASSSARLASAPGGATTSHITGSRRVNRRNCRDVNIISVSTISVLAIISVSTFCRPSISTSGSVVSTSVHTTCPPRNRGQRARVYASPAQRAGHDVYVRSLVVRRRALALLVITCSASDRGTRRRSGTRFARAQGNFVR